MALDLDSEQVTQFAMKSASLLMQTDAGKKAGYWTKPLFGKARVKGGAFVIATYSYFILGCPLAGLLHEPILNEGTVPFLPDAESLVGYYVEFPEVKEILDRHFEESDAFADKTLSPDLRGIVGNSRDLVIRGSPGRGDEALLNILWAITRENQVSIEQAIQSLSVAFIYGASLPAAEVERLWGIQASTTYVPLMDQPLSAARQQTLLDIQELLA